MLGTYKPFQPVNGLVFFPERAVLLASKVHSPLHAPVTLNDAKPSYFWMDIHSLPGACTWFPLVAEMSPEIVNTLRIRSIRVGLCFWLLGWEMAYSYIILDARKDLQKYLHAMWCTLWPRHVQVCSTLWVYNLSNASDKIILCSSAEHQHPL